MTGSERGRPRRGQARVYFARAVDGRSGAEVRQAVIDVASCLPGSGYEVVDGASPAVAQGLKPEELVPTQISLVQSCDYFLLDLSLKDHLYIGCIAELVYARLSNVPSVIYTGNLNLERRPWLSYHATHVTTSLVEAVQWIRAQEEGNAFN
ncbi:hypothetical protein OHB05_34925 [Streptomyces sp. NBC_00638]|uniref:hypothetical protein n=1 Tax=Streptomyces sp. NBC_00638 TaxID=2975794 RepID=UPI00224F8464|nr:hypothetical protein [Streptomyces sp. NBC_00638]MCX5007781.1 hypothetical protein [Streptomyces sp. NBC_00638]